MSRRLLAVLLAAALVVSACSSDKKAKSDPEASQGSSAKLVQVSPLTGTKLAKRPKNPVFVVKIENTEGGAPQHGLQHADMVVEELVEGGLTRLAAFYYSNLPTTVGHVRSMRASDIGIVKPVAGQVVASGGAGGTIDRLRAAGVKVWSEDAGAPGFSSDPAKVRPYNRLMNLKVLARKAKATAIPGPYLTFTQKDGKDAATSSRKASRASVRFSGSSTTQWRFAGGTWKRTNGHAQREFGANTLVVLFVREGNAGYLDPAGNPVPETRLKGRGKAVILAGNRVVSATWQKSTLGSTLSFKGKDGRPVTIRPGKVWLELVPQGAGAVSLR